MKENRSHVVHKKSGKIYRKDYYIASYFIDVMIVVMLATIVFFPIMFSRTLNYYGLAMTICSVGYLNTLHYYRKYIFMNQKSLLSFRKKHNEYYYSSIHKYGIRYDYGLLPKIMIIAVFQGGTIFTLVYPLFIPIGELDITEGGHILVISINYMVGFALFVIIGIEFQNSFDKESINKHNFKNIWVKYGTMLHGYGIFGNTGNIITDHEFFIKGNEELQPGRMYGNK